ncbi:MAG: beta-lactamase family protein [Algicola sp.]|nr:beta-lactamase family protein [Algicola sp.]
MKYFTLFFLLIVSMTFNAVAQTNQRHVDLSRFDQVLKRYEQYGLSGAIMVEKDDKVVYQQGFGYANDERGYKHDNDTRFDLGSVTKHITAVAILKLEAQGRLKTSDKIGTYFDKLDDSKANITITQLLNHTSGLEKDPSYSVVNFSFQLDTQKILAQTQLEFAPGEQFAYSNLGYFVLGYIIEQVSGQSFRQYIKGAIFDPLKMYNSRFYQLDQQMNVSQGYQTQGFDRVAVDNYGFSDIPLWLGGASGVVSNLGDMHLWFKALFNHKVLDEAGFKKLTTPLGEAAKHRASYAFGLRVKQWYGETLITHNGDTSGHQISFSHFVESGYRFVFYVNNRDRWRKKIIALISDSLLGKQTVLLPPFNNKVQLTRLPKSEGLEIVERNDHYYIVATNQQAVFALTDSSLTRAKAKKLNTQAQVFADAFINKDLKVFGERLNLAKHDPKKRMAKIELSLHITPIKAKVLATEPWRSNVFQTHVEFIQGQKTQVIRFVWQSKTDKLMFFASGKSELVVKLLYPVDEHHFVIFDPKEPDHMMVSVVDGIITVE